MRPTQGRQRAAVPPCIRRRRPRRRHGRCRPWSSMGVPYRVAGVLLLTTSLLSTGGSCWWLVLLDRSSFLSSSSVGVSAVTTSEGSAADSSSGGGGGGDDEPLDGGVPTLNETRGEWGARYYMLLGVSGTLQDGFPLRSRLDYNSSITTTPERPFESANGKDDGDPVDREEYVPALFIGRALVRGFKAYLDVKDAGSREYVASPSPPRVPNAVVVATGCREHANLYHVYAVDHRQVANVLADEPRFLGISPDAGLVDLLADDEPADNHGRAAGTDDSVRQLAIRLLANRVLEKDSNSSASTTAPARGDDRVVRAVAIPLVTGVHFRPTFVESPVVHELKDGTAVTSYAESLALWAGADRSDDLVTVSEPSGGGGGDDDGGGGDEATCRASRARRALAWERVHDATRTVERSRLREAAAHPATLACQGRVQLGVGPFQVRLNFPLEAEDLRAFLRAHDGRIEGARCTANVSPGKRRVSKVHPGLD